jgi:type VI secretion system protein
MARGLLDRIAADSAAGSHPVDPFESVLSNLTVVLNARQGSAATCPDFGVPDFTDAMHALPNGTPELCEALRKTIAAYEPRLTNVTVRPSPEQEPGATLRFAISARLMDPASKRVIRFETCFRAGGRVEVG